MQSHIPVLRTDVVALLVPDPTHPPARVIDGTLGAGGHARALLEAGAGHLLGLDQDPAALVLAQANLADFADRLSVQHRNFEFLKAAAQKQGWDRVDAILLDVGVSSMHLDQAERGFSFRQAGPLDMRMNTAAPLTAAAVVNEYDEGTLANLFFRYGEERYARHLARVIAKNRPFTTTDELAGVIEANKPAQWKERIHPATRIFQALRIEVNDELGVLERVLPQAINLLNPGGRMAVISFHSLEDRIVKHAFKHAAEDCICPPSQPICTCDKTALVKRMTRKPITATDDEIAANPRSRSAKLRVVEKL